MNKIRYSLLFLTTLFFANTLLYSQSVALDDSFGNTGIVTTQTPNSSEIIDLLEQNDGKIIAVGYSNELGDYDIQMIRYHSDGSIDASFGINGVVNTNIGNNNLPYSSMLQADGKILVGGSYLSNVNPPFQYHSSLVRYNSDGTLDNSFGLNGILKMTIGNDSDGIVSLGMNPDGKIIAGGFSDNQFLVLQFNIDGTFDTTFGTNGIVLSAFDTPSFIWSMEVQPDGKILAAGNSAIDSFNSFSRIVRYNSDGSIDNGFGDNGTAISYLTHVARHIGLYSDGNFVIAGTSGGDLTLIKYKNNGEVDSTFASNGVFTSTAYPMPSTMEIQSDSKIIVCGNVVVTTYNYGHHIMRFNQDGTIDDAFGNSGAIVLDIQEGNDYTQTVKIQTDNKIIVGGSSRPSSSDPAEFTIVRFAEIPRSLELTIWLEGVNETATGLMETNLSDVGLLPNTQPFNQAPWFYDGMETLPLETAEIVDWVLVELRSGTPSLVTPNTEVAFQQAAVLLSDGSIVGVDNPENRLDFYDISEGQAYYIAVRHRNHLDVLSSNTVAFNSGTIAIYDFTTNINQAFGPQQLTTLPNGKAALYAGDYNGDGIIQSTDYDVWQTEPAAVNVYAPTDGNLDGIIQVTDFDVWFLNKAKVGSAEIQY